MIEWKPDPTTATVLSAVSRAVHPLMYHLRQANRRADEGFEPASTAVIEEHTITPVSRRRCSTSCCSTRDRQRRVDSVRLLVYGAAPMSPTLLESGIKRFGEVFMQTYGMTELSGNVLMLGLEHHHARSTANRTARRVGAWSAGVGTAGGRRHEDVAVGVVGEIVVRGDQVMKGYWRGSGPQRGARRRLDAHRRPGADGRRGLFYIVDRKKDMIISGGENVYPARWRTSSPATGIERGGGDRAATSGGARRSRCRLPRAGQRITATRCRRSAAPRCRLQGAQAGRVRRPMLRATPPARCSSDSCAKSSNDVAFDKG